MIQLFRNVLGVLVIGAIIVGITFSTDILKKKSLPLNIDNNISGGEKVVENLKKDAEWQAEELKKKSMDVTLGDVVNTASRVKKIGEDIQSMKEYAINWVSELFNK